MSAPTNYEQNYEGLTFIKYWCSNRVDVDLVRDALNFSGILYGPGQPRYAIQTNDIKEANLVFFRNGAVKRWRDYARANGARMAFDNLVCSYPQDVRYARRSNRVYLVLDNASQATQYFSEAALLTEDIETAYDYNFFYRNDPSLDPLTLTDIGDFRNWKDYIELAGPFKAEDRVRSEWKAAGVVKYYLDTQGLMRGENSNPFSKGVRGNCKKSINAACAAVGLTPVEVFNEFESDVSFHQTRDFGLWGQVTDGALGLHDLTTNLGEHFVVYWETDSQGFSKRAIIEHEVGHVFGLEHVATPNSTPSSETIMTFNLIKGENTFTQVDLNGMTSYFNNLD